MFRENEPDNLALDQWPEWALQYFQARIAYDPQDVRWSQGFQTAKEWQRLTELSSVSVIEFEQLARDTQRYYKTSHIWFRMAYMISQWGEGKGFPPIITEAE